MLLVSFLVTSLCIYLLGNLVQIGMFVLDCHVFHLLVSVEVVAHLAQVVFKDIMVWLFLPKHHFLCELEALISLTFRCYRLVHLAESYVAWPAVLGVGIGHVQMPCIDRGCPGEEIHGRSYYGEATAFFGSLAHGAVRVQIIQTLVFKVL